MALYDYAGQFGLEATAIGDALSLGTRLLVNAADEGDAADPRPDDVAPGVMVLLSDGETTVGRPDARWGEIGFQALLRRLDREDPSYKM